MTSGSFTVAPPSFLPGASLAQRSCAVEDEPTFYEAMELIALCHRVSGPMSVVTGDPDGEQRIEVRDRDMHYALEGAYRNACRYLKLHFAEATKRFARTEQSDER